MKVCNDIAVQVPHRLDPVLPQSSPILEVTIKPLQTDWGPDHAVLLIMLTSHALLTYEALSGEVLLFHEGDKAF